MTTLNRYARDSSTPATRSDVVLYIIHVTIFDSKCFDLYLPLSFSRGLKKKYIIYYDEKYISTIRQYNYVIVLIYFSLEEFLKKNKNMENCVTESL